MKITRSFSQKLNLGNYQTADFFACYEEEREVDYKDEGTIIQIKTVSNGLYELAKADVEEAIKTFKEELELKKKEEKKLDKGLPF